LKAEETNPDPNFDAARRSIVDSHTHLLPGRLAEKVRAFFNANMEGDLAYPLDHETILARLARAGIATVWSLPYAHKPGVAAGMNASSAAIAARLAGNPVKVVGAGTVHPGDTDPAAIVREAREKYDLKVLKLHCSVGNFEVDDPRLDEAWQYLAGRRIPVIIHLGHAISGHTIVPELLPLERVAQRFPQARLIVAHCGHRAGPQVLDLVEKYPGIYADLTPVVTEPVELPPARVNQLAEKLLFGSDAPNTAVSAEQNLAHIRKFGLEEKALAAILGGTARRLLSEVI
jgi:predicted TIM-barrel fold metal-dependent hydrolase